MIKYICGKCGKNFETNSVKCCGMEDIKMYKEGEFVSDVLVYICDDCFTGIKRNAPRYL